jgi:hypothetical protein
VIRRFSGDLICPFAIGSLFARGNPPVQFDPMSGRDAVVQNLPVERVDKAKV